MATALKAAIQPASKLQVRFTRLQTKRKTAVIIW
jgi:hypothetical protein